VNPGGVELWKRGARERTELDTPIGSTRVTPRAILETLADAPRRSPCRTRRTSTATTWGCPATRPPRWRACARSEGRRAHFTHLQYHSYGGAPRRGLALGRARADRVRQRAPRGERRRGAGDVRAATTLTADAPVEYLLHRSSGRAGSTVDIELETGCGIVPYSYRRQGRRWRRCSGRSGSELFLLSADPWRVVLSTDHPNGGSFVSYPELIRLLMDRAYRDDQLKRVNPKLLAGSALADGIAREYTLNEIAIVTRAGPARILGLRDKGHLGVGADADVTVYARDADAAKMFATPRYVLKGGALVVEEGELRRAPSGRRLHVRPAHDAAVARDLKRFFDAHATVSFENYPVGALRDAPLLGDA
jgi:formylmethanofuran dehydrogenase subunit A